MNIIILGYAFGFPNGTGAAARVLAYATGLQAEGAQVQVLCLKPTEPGAGEVVNPEAAGVFQGIPFAYACCTSRRSKRRLRNALLYLKGLVRAAVVVWRMRYQRQPAVVLAFLCDDPVYLAYLWVVARWSGATLIGERNEYPLVYEKNGIKTKIIAWINDHWLYPRLDGIIVISKFLEAHFTALVTNRVPILRVPILVDGSRFSALPSPAALPVKMVAYCGNFDHDGEVARVLDTFALATADDPSWTLRLIGHGSPERTAKIERLILEHRMDGRVALTGQVASARVPQLLADASILVLPRVWGRFSQAGFPTKLGEYLATGKPVVVTATGDIPDYLTDRESAYLVQADGVAAFAEQLEYVMKNMAAAQVVGQIGRKVAEQNFDVNRHSRRMLDWFEQVAEVRYPH